MTTSVRQILATKGARTYSVAPEAKVFEALSVMAEHDIGCVLVVRNERLEGIFTERDYARKVILMGRSSHDVKVSELMTSTVFTVSPEHTLDEVMNIMTNNRFRHLPVIDEEKIVGIVTIGDAVKHVILEQEATIEHLSNYIAGDIAT